MPGNKPKVGEIWEVRYGSEYDLILVTGFDNAFKLLDGLVLDSCDLDEIGLDAEYDLGLITYIHRIQEAE